MTTVQRTVCMSDIEGGSGDVLQPSLDLMAMIQLTQQALGEVKKCTPGLHVLNTV